MFSGSSPETPVIRREDGSYIGLRSARQSSTGLPKRNEVHCGAPGTARLWDYVVKANEVFLHAQATWRCHRRVKVTLQLSLLHGWYAGFPRVR
jgi:hypothetical protein